MAEVIMYCTDSCSFCNNADKLFAKKGVEITKIDIDKEEGKLAEMIDKSGRETVPQIFIDGKHIGGFDDLSELDMDDELDPLLFS